MGPRVLAPPHLPTLCSLTVRRSRMPPGGVAREKLPEGLCVRRRLRGGPGAPAVGRAEPSGQPVCSGHRTLRETTRMLLVLSSWGPKCMLQTGGTSGAHKRMGQLSREGGNSGLKSQEGHGARGGGVARWGKNCFSHHRFPSLKAAAEETLKSLRPYGGPPK